MNFADFMAVALYDPEAGYYAATSTQVGKHGDFFTSVSVGPLFGELLARRFLEVWKQCGSPTRWRITECGAHDGTLAADILRALAALSSAAFAGLEYAIPEPLTRLRETQQTRLAEFSHVRHYTDATELADDPLPGVIFGNEVLDALPCHLIERSTKNWNELFVTADSNGILGWESRPVENRALIEALAKFPPDLPVGYRTEVRTCFKDFLAPLVRSLPTGSLFWIDYGFARREYYDASRTSGTLRTFSRHCAGENPLDAPGLCDITAHVDFTAVAETGQTLGATPTCFESQGAWLTKIAAPMFQGTTTFPQSFVRQFQTLTHPAHLGMRFHVLEQAVGRPCAADASADAMFRLDLLP